MYRRRAPRARLKAHLARRIGARSFSTHFVTAPLFVNLRLAERRRKLMKSASGEEHRRFYRQGSAVRAGEVHKIVILWAEPPKDNSGIPYSLLLPELHKIFYFEHFDTPPARSGRGAFPFWWWASGTRKCAAALHRKR